MFLYGCLCNQRNVQRPESRVQHLESSVQSPASSVQRPASRVQRPESSVQSPASRVQRPESSVQLFVQSPGIPVCLFYITLQTTVNAKESVDDQKSSHKILGYSYIVSIAKLASKKNWSLNLFTNF